MVSHAHGEQADVAVSAVTGTEAEGAALSWPAGGAGASAALSCCWDTGDSGTW